MAKKKHNKSLVDMVFTQGWGDDYACCITNNSGFLYGVSSSRIPCKSNHKIDFVDNDYKNYNHEKHKRFVESAKPKYATVVDLFTPEQSLELGIKHYELDSVLKMAEELKNYAEHIIVIPKYDCIDDIPDEYILGYSVPTSYGKTTVPVERFAHRKVHLLGGSPKRQYLLWAMLPDSVVSIDSNYLRVVSKYSRITNFHLINKVLGTSFPESEGVQLKDLGFGNVMNPFYVSFTINIGFYQALFSKHPRDFDLTVEINKLKGKLYD